MAVNSLAAAPEQTKGFKAFLEGLRGFIRGYHELIAEVAAWLASISCIAIASVIFLGASDWRNITINISLGLINLAVEAALFGSGGAYYAAKERGDASEKNRQALICFFYGALTLVTVAFGAFKLTDARAIATLDITRVAAAILYVFLSLNASHSAPANTTPANDKITELEAQIAELQQRINAPVAAPEIDAAQIAQIVAREIARSAASEIASEQITEQSSELLANELPNDLEDVSDDESEQSGEQITEEVANGVPNIFVLHSANDYRRNSEQSGEQKVAAPANNSANKTPRARSQKSSAAGAMKRIEQVLKKEPNIKVSDLARRANVSVSYASEKKRELQAIAK